LTFEITGWILETVAAFLKSPDYVVPVMNLIDEKCICFDDNEENYLELTAIHNEFIALVFRYNTSRFHLGSSQQCDCAQFGTNWGFRRLLEEFLGSIGVEQEEFAKVCQSAISEKSQISVVFHQIMSVEDFPTFKVRILEPFLSTGAFARLHITKKLCADDDVQTECAAQSGNNPKGISPFHLHPQNHSERFT
jgi:hypothetical protein